MVVQNVMVAALPVSNKDHFQAGGEETNHAVVLFTNSGLGDLVMCMTPLTMHVYLNLHSDQYFL